MSGRPQKKFPWGYTVFLAALTALAGLAGYLIYAYPWHQQRPEKAAISLARLSDHSKLKSRIILKLSEIDFAEAQKEAARFEQKEILGENPLNALKPEEELSPVWAVELLSTQDAVELKRILDLLSDSSRNIYSYRIQGDGSVWYRVRAGFFSSVHEAEKAADELFRQYELPNPVIVKPDALELKLYFDPKAETAGAMVVERSETEMETEFP